MMSEHDPLEDFFRDRAESENHPFDERDWDALEARLDREIPVRGGNFWGLMLSATLLLSMPWWPWEIEGPSPYEPTHTITNTELELKSNEPVQSTPVISGVESSTEIIPSSSVRNSITPGAPEVDYVFATATYPETISTASNPTALTRTDERPLRLEYQDLRSAYSSESTEFSLTPSTVNSTGKILESTFEEEDSQSNVVAFEMDENEEVPRRIWRPYLLAGLEYGGTQMNNAPQAGFRVGAGVRYFPISQLSLSGGLNYANINYSCYGTEYQTDTDLGYGLSLDWTDGYCQMVELPIEVRWHPTEWLNIGAGVRSYFITGQKYDHFIKNSQGPDIKVPYETRETSSAFAGHLKFNAGFVVPVGRYQLELQPFYQIPLRGMGEGNVWWNSAGASVIFLF